MDTLTCRHCGSTNCEHGDHCAECGCPECGWPGVQAKDHQGLILGWCIECGYEMTPGAREAWRARQPKLTTHQMKRQLLEAMGLPLQPDDEVGAPIYLTR